MDVLCSIRPNFADAIYRGVKKVEWRPIVPRRDVDRVWLYETNGVRMVTGWFKFDGCTPRVNYDVAYHIYGPLNITGRQDSIETIQKLFAGRRLYGMLITHAERVEPFNPFEVFGIRTVPASWRYLPEKNEDELEVGV